MIELRITIKDVNLPEGYTGEALDITAGRRSTAPVTPREEEFLAHINKVIKDSLQGYASEVGANKVVIIEKDAPK